MLAAVLPRIGASLEVVEVELAEPRAGEVRVRLHASGVCHSDLNAADGTAATRCPAVLGHEGAGVIRSVGPGTRIKPGTRVVLSWMPSCGECEECVRGLEHLCQVAWTAMGHGGLLDGTPRLSRDGAAIYHYSFLSTFAQEAVVPERCCVPITTDTPFEVAALVGCAVATGLGAVWRTAQARPGDRVAVFGCGGVGLSAVLGALTIGATPVVAVDVAPAKLAMARELGATATVAWAGSAEATAEAVRAASAGGVDYAVEATGRPEAMLAAFLSTRPRGAAVLIGISRSDAVLSLPAVSIPRAERRILGSAYGSIRPHRDFPTILRLHAQGRLPLDRLITHRLPLQSAQQALDLVRTGVAVRSVLTLDGSGS
ncbi:MAG TPA: alcohol dehydrogenase catalytic domain-containing protein [Candidatus Dormibacteraeota bacterium]|jgi:S-(hydroxymethyl)glutathione dehydrogenase/alcohol dehydrogenase